MPPVKVEIAANALVKLFPRGPMPTNIPLFLPEIVPELVMPPVNVEIDA